MAGELWRGIGLVGVESTPGTLATRTRKVYLRDPSLTDDRPPTPQRFAVGTRDNVRAITRGSSAVAGQVSFPMSPAEIIEWLLITIKGAVTPTLSGATQTWTFTPSTTGVLDSMSLELNDGARVLGGAGIRGNQLTIAGSAQGENIVTVDLFGTARTIVSATTPPADRVPQFLLGWQSKLWIEAFGGTPGTTIVPATMTAWNVVFGNNLGRKYFADNTQLAGAIVSGELDVTATITMEAAAAATLTEFNNWDSDTPRVVRLDFPGVTNDLGAAQTSGVAVDIPGHWTTPNFVGEDGGTRVYEFGLTAKYDPTNAFAAQFKVKNGRATAWGAT